MCGAFSPVKTVEAPTPRADRLACVALQQFAAASILKTVRLPASGGWDGCPTSAQSIAAEVCKQGNTPRGKGELCCHPIRDIPKFEIAKLIILQVPDILAAST